VAGEGLGWRRLRARRTPAVGRRQQVPDLPSAGEGGGKRQASFEEGLHRDLGNTRILNLALVPGKFAERWKKKWH